MNTKRKTAEYRKSLYSIIRNIETGRYNTIKELDADLDNLINNINAERESLKSKLSLILKCQHPTYHPPTYTIQRRYMGNFVYVYERVCSVCGKPQTFQCVDERGAPAWAEDATRRFFNTNI